MGRGAITAEVIGTALEEVEVEGPCFDGMPNPVGKHPVPHGCVTLLSTYCFETQVKHMGLTTVIIFPYFKQTMLIMDSVEICCAPVVGLT